VANIQWSYRAPSVTQTTKGKERSLPSTRGRNLSFHRHDALIDASNIDRHQRSGEGFTLSSFMSYCRFLIGTYSYMLFRGQLALFTSSKRASEASLAELSRSFGRLSKIPEMIAENEWHLMEHAYSSNRQGTPRLRITALHNFRYRATVQRSTLGASFAALPIVAAS